MMGLEPFSYKQVLHVGEQRAENDAEFLQNKFVSISANGHVESERSALILGRKGAGKTALRLHFQNHENGHFAASLKPSDSDVTRLYYLAIDDSQEDHLIEALQFYLEAIIYYKAYELIHSKYPDKIRAPQEINRNFSDSLPGNNEQRVGISTLLDVVETLRSSFGSHKPFSDSVIRLKSAVIESVLANNFKIFIMIDSLDDALHLSTDTNSRVENFKEFFESLILLFRRLTNQEETPTARLLFLKIFIPTDLYRFAVGRHFDHLREYTHEMRWPENLLREFLCLRLHSNLSEKQKKHIDQIKKKKEKQEEIFYSFFPRTVTKRSFFGGQNVQRGKSTFDEFLDLSLHRPRDLIHLVQTVDERTKDEALDFPNDKTMEAAFTDYSQALLTSVIKEYETVFHDLEHFTDILTGGRHTIPANQLRCALFENDDKVDDKINKLYESGIIGGINNSSISARGNRSAMTAVYYYNEPHANIVSGFENYRIHQGFWRALRIVNIYD